jgi:membrane peptidoglycan carboxypeptidase
MYNKISHNEKIAFLNLSKNSNSTEETNSEILELEKNFIEIISVDLKDFQNYLSNTIISIEDCIFHDRFILSKSLSEKGIDKETVYLLVKSTEDVIKGNYNNLSWTLISLYEIIHDLPFLKK